MHAAAAAPVRRPSWAGSWRAVFDGAHASHPVASRRRGLAARSPASGDGTASPAALLPALARFIGESISPAGGSTRPRRSQSQRIYRTREKDFLVLLLYFF